MPPRILVNSAADGEGNRTVAAAYGRLGAPPPDTTVLPVSTQIHANILEMSRKHETLAN